MKWEPEKYHKDPMVNAVLNLAAEMSHLAEATNKLLYGLKYSETDGLSVAEAIEVAANKINASIEGAASTIGTSIDSASE